MFKIEIIAENAAFSDCSPEKEVITILQRIITKLETGAYDPCGSPSRIFDSNGNTCGMWLMDEQQ